MIMNRPLHLASKEDARAKWSERFNNRSPADRTPAELDIRAAQDTTEIMLYGEIGFWGVTAKEFNTALAKIKTPSVLVRIKSEGGDVFDGLAIYEALRSHPATITTKVEGWAASAASFIALAGNTVTIADSAFMMIHKAWGFAVGNSADMLDMAATLEKIDGNLADIYAAKTGQTSAEMLKMMTGASDGTWFTASEAKEIGLVDSIIGADDTSNASMAARVVAMKRRLAIMERDG